MRRASIFLLLFATLTAAADTTERLSTIARVWGAVKFTHPYLGYRDDIDWDAAGVRAAERARGSEPVESIVAEMLAAMGDPMTRVVPACTSAPAPLATPPLYDIYDGGVVYIPLSTLENPSYELAGVVRSARHVVLDLRTPAGRCATPELGQLPKLTPELAGGTMPLPDERKVRHWGYRSQDPELDGGYNSDFAVTKGTLSGSGSAANVIFLADSRTTLPPLALALLRAQRARIVSFGPFGEEAAVSHLRAGIGNGFEAVIRAGELSVDGNAFTIGASATLPASATKADALNAVFDMIRPSSRRRSVTAPASTRTLPPYVFRRDARYAEMKYPGFGYRMLAAFRLWNVIHYFYGYPHLIGDWNARLPEIINLLTNASSQREYDLALAKIMTWVPDGHSMVYAPSYLDLRGRYTTPFALMPVEGRPVVVELIDGPASNGVVPGDELIAIDGRPVSERYAELDEYVSGSHEAARAYYITGLLGNAATASEATFTFRKPSGQTYDATIRRAAYARVAPPKPWRVMPGNIGYVDLRWLENAQVDTMINEVMGTKGLIIDIRNYPRGVFPRLGRRLNTRGLPANVASFRVPLLSGGVGGFDPFLQDLGSSSQPVYKGKVIALINERAQSQSEHTCLVLEALNGTTFVGSPTVGANGNVTLLAVPGDILIMFTGMDVRHLDGRQLQRIGILPHVEVPRTMEMTRQQRDEVLEKAIEMLR